MTDKQYSSLESTFEKYKDRGFRVLAFPANNFGKQEPGTNAQIKKFCAARKVTFDLMAKLSVEGKDQHPLYKFLTKHANERIAGKVRWNFQKYLVSRTGTVVAKFGPTVIPSGKELTTKLEELLKAPRQAIDEKAQTTQDQKE